MSHVPLFSLGTGASSARIRNVMCRLTGRDVKLTEDTTTVTVEALDAVANRLEALERAVSRRHESP